MRSTGTGIKSSAPSSPNRAGIIASFRSRRASLRPIQLDDEELLDIRDELKRAPPAPQHALKAPPMRKDPATVERMHAEQKPAPVVVSAEMERPSVGLVFGEGGVFPAAIRMQEENIASTSGSEPPPSPQQRRRTHGWMPRSGNSPASTADPRYATSLRLGEAALPHVMSQQQGGAWRDPPPPGHRRRPLSEGTAGRIRHERPQGGASREEGRRAREELEKRLGSVRALTAELLAARHFDRIRELLAGEPDLVNAVHVSVAYRRLASLYGRRGGGLAARRLQQEQLFDLLERLGTLAEQHAASMKPQEVSGVLWAAATLDYPLESHVMDALIEV